MSKTYINKLTMKTNNPFTILHSNVDPVAQVYVQASTAATVYTGSNVTGSVTQFLSQASNARIRTVSAGINTIFDLNSLAFNNVVVSSDIYGGALSLDAKGKVNKVGAGVTVAGVGEVDISMVGGSARMVFGGGAGYGSSVDKVHISIDNSTINKIYGGGSDGATVGSVDIVIGGGRIVARSGRIGAIYGGGMNATVDGPVNITFNAGSAALKFGGTVSGNGTGKNSYVLGEKTLHFEDYAGKFAGTIQSFDTVQFVGMSQVEFTKSQDKTMSGAVYEFVLTDASIGNPAAMLTWNSKIKTGSFEVTIADDGDYKGQSTVELLNSGKTITLLSSKYLRTASDFDPRNIRVQNELGEQIADYSYDIDYIYGKKGGTVSITYTGAPLTITGEYAKNLYLTSANDYVNVVAGSIMAGAVNMGAGVNKLVVQTSSVVSGEIIFAANSTNTVLVSGMISGMFDSREGSHNTVRLNAGWAVDYSYNYPYSGVLDFVGSGNDTVVMNTVVTDLSGIHFGKGSDVLVLNAQYNGNVTYEDGGDIIVANVNQTLNPAKIGLQGTGNALVVGNGREVTIDNTWFATGAFGGDTGAVLSGVYLNDNASILVINRGGDPDLRVIQNFTGDIRLTGGDIYIQGVNGDAPAALSAYYTNSGTGFNGTILASDLSSANNVVTIGGKAKGTIALSGGEDAVNFVKGDAVVGGTDLYLSGVETISVADDVTAVLSDILDDSVVNTNLGRDAKLIFTDKKNLAATDLNGTKYSGSVVVGTLTKNVDFGDAVYLGSGNVVFEKGVIDADLTFNNQVVWFNGALFSLDSSFTFEGASALGFSEDGVWDWQDTTLAAGATLGVYGTDGAKIRIDGQISAAEVKSVLAHSELDDNSMLGVASAIYIQDWDGDYSDAANWIAPEIDTLPFSNLVVMTGGNVKATTFNFGNNSETLEIQDGVVMRGLGNTYDYITISGDADANSVSIGDADIYGMLKTGDGADSVVLNGATFHHTANMPVADLGSTNMPVLIATGAAEDLLIVKNSLIEGSLDTGSGNDLMVAVNSTVKGSLDMGSGDNRLYVTGVKNEEGFNSATSTFGELLATDGNIDVRVFDNGVLSGADGKTLFIGNVNNSTGNNKVFVGHGQDKFGDELDPKLAERLNTGLYDVRSSGTVASDLCLTGATNTVLAGVDEDINYGAAGVGDEETIRGTTVPAGFTATIDGNVIVRNGSLKDAEPAGANKVSYGVQAVTNGSYQDSEDDGPDKHKQALLSFSGTVTVNMTGVTIMGDPELERKATVYSSITGLDDLAMNSQYADVAAVNLLGIGYRLNALQEGTIKVNGDVAITAGDTEAELAVVMTGQSNTLDMGIDVYAGEQGLIDMNDSTVTVTVNGDVNMLAVGVNGTGSNIAQIGLWRLDNWSQAVKESPYDNSDSDTADGILSDTSLSDYTVTVNGNLTLYGVGDIGNGDAFDVNNHLRMMRRSTVTGDITVGEYYRDTWTNSNTMIVDDGTVLANKKVTLIGADNVVDFFGTGGSTAQKFSLFGLDNWVNVGGVNPDAVWDTLTDTITHSYTSYDAVIGNITSDNLFDSNDDQFAAQDYLNGELRDYDDYADLTATITGSKVDGNIVAYGSTTVGHVTGFNSVTVGSVIGHVSQVTGNIELTTNSGNAVSVSGVDGARALVDGSITVVADKGLTSDNSNYVFVGLATTGDITTKILADVVGASNSNVISLGVANAGTTGDAIVGDIIQSAVGVATNTLSAVTDTNPLLSINSARRANTMEDISQSSYSGVNVISIVGQGGGAPATTAGDITQSSSSGNNSITLTDMTVGDVTMTTGAANALRLAGSVNAGTHDLTGVSVGTGTVTLIEGMTLTADEVTGFSHTVLDFTQGAVGVNAIDCNANNWDSLEELGNLDVIVNSSDFGTFGGSATLITGENTFTGTNSIDLTLAGINTISLVWNGSSYASGSVVDGKLWSITGHDTNTLTLHGTIV